MLSQAMTWIYSVIYGTVEWLLTWSYAGVPFLYWLIGFAIISTTLKFIFG